MKTKIKETIDGAIQMADGLNMKVAEISLNEQGFGALKGDLFQNLPEGVEMNGLRMECYRGYYLMPNHESGAPLISIKLISKLVMTLLMPLLMMSCSEVQLVAQGPIANTEDYTLHIKEYTSGGQVYWMEWEPWAWYNEYQINVPKRMNVECLFISKVDGDTLAHVHFVATDKRVKCDTPVRFDGTTQYIGIDEPAADARFETYANTTER